MDCFVYIMASGHRGTLYIGVTSDLVQRVWQHKEHTFGGFTEQYAIDRLVWFAGTPDIEEAIKCEKQMKKWLREWKIELVERSNPKWRDLYPDILGAAVTPALSRGRGR
jgi:putative endonuclease